MRNALETLQIEKSSPEDLIKKQYSSFFQELNKEGNTQQLAELHKAYNIVLGDKKPLEQLTILITELNQIILYSEKSNCYEHYDSEQFDSENHPVFNVTFYAHGEAIKCCREVYRILTENMEKILLNEKEITPVLNIVLMKLITVFNFKHHSQETPLGGVYREYCEILASLLIALRPSLKSNLMEIFKVNRSIPTDSEETMSRSLVLQDIEEIKEAVKKVIHRQEPSGKENQAPTASFFKTAALEKQQATPLQAKLKAVGA